MKRLFSGKVFMGDCGEPTELCDSFGKKLSVGDLVIAFSVERSAEIAEISADEPQYIVKSEEDLEPFIMGMKGCKRNTHYYKDGEETTEDDYDYQEDTYDYEHGFNYRWFVKKIKGYEKIADGEVWGIGNVTAREV